MKKRYLHYFFLVFLISCTTQEEANVVIPKFLIKKTVKFNNGTLYKSTEYSYDENKLTQLVFRDGNDNVTGKGIIIYNNQLPIRINEYDSNNNLIKYVLIEYETNQLAKYIEYNTVDNTAKKYLISYATNIISKNIYSGDFSNQNALIASKSYEINNNNITKVISNNYNITYTYDNLNGIFKNIASKTILNIMGRLHSPLEFGTNNNALSYEFVQGNITDHINLNYTYDNENFPINLVETSTEFGDGNSTEFEYQ